MDKEEQSLGGGKELRTLIGNFSAHLEGGGGSDGARPPLSLTPLCLPVPLSLPQALQLPPPLHYLGTQVPPAGCRLSTLRLTSRSFAQPFGNPESVFASLSPLSVHTHTSNPLLIRLLSAERSTVPAPSPRSNLLPAWRTREYGSSPPAPHRPGRFRAVAAFNGGERCLQADGEVLI